MAKKMQKGIAVQGLEIQAWQTWPQFQVSLCSAHVLAQVCGRVGQHGDTLWASI